ncbi:MAG TPA: hypothetical protein VNK46_15650 [Nitrospiraceae bacterium]|jgi:hypothetical protein|nr:hypothetical protein [Nitrospiraceae bacterium]
MGIEAGFQHVRKRLLGRAFVWGLLLGSILWPVGSGRFVGAEKATEPKSIHKTCGTCPEGYATTGVTTAPEICKDGEPTLVQCVPLGANILPVCGSCPEGYVQIGSSLVPARCGDKDGGLLSQCQLQHMEPVLPDPTTGGLTCPPDCGSTPPPGHGVLPSPPQSRPAPDKKKTDEGNGY